MAELLQQAVSLTVLRVRLSEVPCPSGSTTSSNQDSEPCVNCELEVTGNAQERGLALPAGQATDPTPSATVRTVAQWSLPPKELQLPQQFSETAEFLDRANTPGRVTSGMMEQLGTFLPSLMRAGDCLWVDLAEPAEYLPLLPWEEMLRRLTPAPVLRLSPHVIKALSPEQELSVVLCLTVPSDAWVPSINQLAVIARSIRESLPPHSKLHIFADDLCYKPFAGAKEIIASDVGRQCDIILHDLPTPGGEPGKENLSEQSWRAWIMESLSGCAVDIVHCLSPGLLFADQPRLVIARDASPRFVSDEAEAATESVARLVGYVTPVEHGDLLTSLGAWGAIFSSPAVGPALVQSRLGLRLFVDHLARLRPGVAVFHDLEMDPTCEALAKTYKFIIGDPSIIASASPAVTVYCHPARAANVATKPSSGSSELMAQYEKVEEKIRSVIDRPGSVRAWVAATQRIIEHAVSNISIADAKEPDNSAVLGVASALKVVEKILAKQEDLDLRAPQAPQSGGSTDINEGVGSSHG